MSFDFNAATLDSIASMRQGQNDAVIRQSTQEITRAKGLENDQEQLEQGLAVQGAQRLSDLAAGKQPQQGEALFSDVGEDSSQAMPLEIMADVYLKGGAPKQASEFMKNASEIRKQEQEISKSKVDAAKSRTENVAKVSGFVNQTLAGVGNESEWQFAKRRLSEAGVLEPEHMAELDKLPYSPDVVAFFQQEALTAYQRSTLDLSQARAAQVEQDSTFRQSNQAKLTEIAQARLQLSRDTQARLDKGGKSASSPSPQEVASATATLNAQLGLKTKPSKEVMAAGAQAVAARAKAMVASDKSLTWETAVNRAVIESKANGDWQETPEESNWIADDVPAKAKFDPGVIPTTSEGKVDAKALRKGRVYITAKGRAKWDGSNFIKVED